MARKSGSSKPSSSRRAFLSSAQKYKLVLTISGAIASHATHKSLFHAIARILKESFPFDCTAITVYRAERDVFEVTAIEPFLSSVELSTGFELARDGSHSGWVFDHGQPAFAKDLRRKKHFANDAMLLEQGLRSYVVVPMVAPGGETIGTFNVGSDVPNRYGEGDLEFLDLVSRQIGMAVDQISRQELLMARESELRRTREALTTKDDAFEQLLEHVNGRRQGVRQAVCLQVREAIMPFLDSLQTRLERGQVTRLGSLREQVDEVLSREIDGVMQRLALLTPRERLVATHIRDGLTSKEIAERLHLALVTVNTHRDNIRKKLGIANQKINLGTYLQTRGAPVLRSFSSVSPYSFRIVRDGRVGDHGLTPVGHFGRP